MKADATAWLYCEQKVAPPGSDWYYALLKAPDDIKQVSLALLALEADWQAILSTCQEPRLVELKFAWWQQELNDAFHGNPTHPALQLLAPMLKVFNLPQKLLTAMLEQAEQGFYRFDNFSDLQRAAFSGIDARFIIGLYVLAQRDPDITTPLHSLQFSLQLLESIIHLPEQLRLGALAFAISDLQRFALEPEEPQHWPTEKLTPLLNHYHQQALNFYQQAMDNFSPTAKIQLKPLLRYAKLQVTLAKKIAQAGYPVLTKKITLTPVRKLFKTWFD